MQITIIGAGAMGSAIAQNLVTRQEVSKVRVCDANARSLQRLADSIDSNKLQSYQINARDVPALAPIIKGSHCVVGAMGYDRVPELATLALDSSSHYCDLGGSEEALDSLMGLSDRARQAGRWIVPGCGLAPGLVNVLSMLGVSQFERATTVHIRVGDLPVDPQPPFQFNLSWSAEKVLDDYTGQVRMIEDGALVTCKPLERVESIEFEAPFGSLEAFCTAGALQRLPDELDGKVDLLDLKTIRWPGHADRMSFLLALGLGDPLSVDVRTHLTYRDLLLRRMRQRMGAVQDDAVLMRIVIHGRANDLQRTLRYEMVERVDPTTGLSAMKRCTSIPAAVMACQLGQGLVPGGGAATPEMVIPGEPYLRELRASGLNISETWADGHHPVAAA